MGLPTNRDTRSSFQALRIGPCLDLSPQGFLNIHPSLLPIHRGPAPLQATILHGDLHTGITIIKIDALMDHGPIVVQQKECIPEDMWPCTTKELSEYMAKKSALLLIQTLPSYIAGTCNLVEQHHDDATYTHMIEKKNGEVLWDDIVNKNLHSIYVKYCAYKEWPEVFFMHNNKRVKIKHMSYVNGIYTIDRVTPEGKSEIAWSEYLTHHS